MADAKDVDAGGLVKLDPATGLPQSAAEANAAAEAKEKGDAAPTA